MYKMVQLFFILEQTSEMFQTQAIVWFLKGNNCSLTKNYSIHYQVPSCYYASAIEANILRKKNIRPETLSWIYASEAHQTNIYNTNTLESRIQEMNIFHIKEIKIRILQKAFILSLILRRNCRKLKVYSSSVKLQQDSAWEIALLNLYLVPVRITKYGIFNKCPRQNTLN